MAYGLYQTHANPNEAPLRYGLCPIPCTNSHRHQGEPQSNFTGIMHLTTGVSKTVIYTHTHINNNYYSRTDKLALKHTSPFSCRSVDDIEDISG